MLTEKIADAPRRCIDPDHEPPTYVGYELGGTYRHTCPACGKSIVFVVTGIQCSAGTR